VVANTALLNPPAATIEWPSPPANPPLAGNEIHVWATTLAVEPAILEKLTATLTPDEKERANRFKFEHLRNRYIAGRGALRENLARYVGEDAAALRFEYLENGKPVLTREFASAGIHFNLAHTGDLALVAITRIGLVGVDVESVRTIKNADELVARFFSKREDELFQKVPAEQKPVAFFNLWTRKEALLKATGEGITRSLNLVEVSFLPGEPARLLAISGDAKAAEAWQLKELSPAKEFAGAVAVQAGTSNIQLGDAELVVKCWKWNCEL
jgi:4'-phosphopantetheinyl transferase